MKVRNDEKEEGVRKGNAAKAVAAEGRRRIKNIVSVAVKGGIILMILIVIHHLMMIVGRESDIMNVSEDIMIAAERGIGTMEIVRGMVQNVDIEMMMLRGVITKNKSFIN